MNKVENVMCVKDFFDVNNIRLFTKGEVYKLGGTSITTNVENRSFMFYSEKDDFLNKHFVPVNLIREYEPIEPQQQSEHYQKENGNDIETIDKMQIISDIFEEQGRTFTAMEGYTLLNQYKYLDRMGKKDDPKKEGYKICDYYERNKSEKWLHETIKKGDSTC